MCVEEKVEIVKADYRFLLRRGAEAILVDEHIDVLAYPRRQRGASRARKNQHLTFFMSLSRVDRSLDPPYQGHAFSEPASSSSNLKPRRFYYSDPSSISKIF